MCYCKYICTELGNENSEPPLAHSLGRSCPVGGLSPCLASIELSHSSSVPSCTWIPYAYLALGLCTSCSLYSKDISLDICLTHSLMSYICTYATFSLRFSLTILCPLPCCIIYLFAFSHQCVRRVGIVASISVTHTVLRKYMLNDYLLNGHLGVQEGQWTVGT